ncbi:MAG: hypothetical protein IJY16_06720, partial [Clostridia bacterium]|nr:hypothetical protein [Clostridia bacterium]
MKMTVREEPPFAFEMVVREKPPFAVEIVVREEPPFAVEMVVREEPPFAKGRLLPLSFRRREKTFTLLTENLQKGEIAHMADSHTNKLGFIRVFIKQNDHEQCALASLRREVPRNEAKGECVHKAA